MSRQRLLPPGCWHPHYHMAPRRGAPCYCGLYPDGFGKPRSTDPAVIAAAFIHPAEREDAKRAGRP